MVNNHNGGILMDKQVTYHFTGIKGSGMSALALILHGDGYKVQGSDFEEYMFTQKGLDAAGISLFPFSKENIHEGLVVIAGNAFGDEHEELVEARKIGVPVIRYHAFLGELASHYTSVAVTGSHGKTSTTGLLSHVLSAVKSTNFLIGEGTGFGCEGAEYFVFEACEYKRHFLSYKPNYAIITNIDFDHPDYYSSIDDVTNAFQEFARQVRTGLIVCGDDTRLQHIQAEVPITYYGLEEHNHVVAKNIVKDTVGSHFDVEVNGEYYAHLDIPTFGTHNILNALAVTSFWYLNNLDVAELEKAIQTFGGVKRRFSEKKVGDVTIIDDYAHHPSEIRATLDAARQKYVGKKIIAVFQPHTFSRTIALKQEFAEALSLADEVYVCDIFGSARETSGDVSAEDVVALITDKKASVLKMENISPLLQYESDVVVFMGAGDVQKFEFAYATLLSETLPNVN